MAAKAPVKTAFLSIEVAQKRHPAGLYRTFYMDGRALGNLFGFCHDVGWPHNAVLYAMKMGRPYEGHHLSWESPGPVEPPCVSPKLKETLTKPVHLPSKPNSLLGRGHATHRLGIGAN